MNLFFNWGLTAGLLVFFIGCSEHPKHENKNESPFKPAPVVEAGKVVSMVSSNGSSYTYYVPVKFSGTEKYPVMIFFDPHAKGNIPVEKYKGLAERFQFLLVGSNDSKNGMELSQSVGIAAGLRNESSNVLPGMPERMTISGFSGGAKVSLAAGNSVEGFQSVVYSGAAFSTNSFVMKVPVLGYTGARDMNYTEVKTFDGSISDSTSHCLVEWNGRHEWPDSATFAYSFYWNIFNSMRKNQTSINESLISEFRNMLNASISSEKDYLQKASLLKSGISMLSGIAPVNSYKIRLADLSKVKAFKVAEKKQAMTLMNEDLRKKELISSFESQDLLWWNIQVASLMADTNSESNQRLLGYISLAAYSYSTKAVEANNVPLARKALEIYRLADPQNPEHEYLEACLFSKNNVADSAIYFLQEAMELGFSDRARIENEKDLFAIRDREEYRKLIATLR